MYSCVACARGRERIGGGDAQKHVIVDKGKVARKGAYTAAVGCVWMRKVASAAVPAPSEWPLNRSPYLHKARSIQVFG